MCINMLDMVIIQTYCCALCVLSVGVDKITIIDVLVRLTSINENVAAVLHEFECEFECIYWHT